MPALLYIPWFKAEAWEIPIGDTVIPIQPFGVLVAIGVLSAAKVAELWGKRNGVAPHAVNDMVAHVTLSALISSYFLNAAFYHPERLVQIVEDPTNLWKVYLGLSSFGGFLGAIGGLLLWWWRRRLPPIAIGEAACFCFPVGWIFGRIGCFVTHDHPGAVTDFFLAVDNYNLRGEPRHDMGLYEVFWSVGITAIFFYLARKPRPRGFYMWVLPISYAPVRFMLDFLRAGPEDGGDVRYFYLTPGQWGAIALLGIGLAVWWRVRTHGVAEIPPHARWPESEQDEDGAAHRKKKRRRRADAGEDEAPAQTAKSASKARKKSKKKKSKGGSAEKNKSTASASKKKAAASSDDGPDADGDRVDDDRAEDEDDSADVGGGDSGAHGSDADEGGIESDESAAAAKSN